MKKKVLSTLLAAAMVVSLAACGGGDQGGQTTGDSAATDGGAAADGADAGAADAGTADAGTEVDPATTITIWVANEVVDFTKEQADTFMAANPDYATFAINIEAVGEGDAAGNMLTDVLGGPDIYGFAQDQISRLVGAGALMQLTDTYAQFVADNNDAGAASAAKMGDATYAFPLTSDNGYFLYYDKSVVTDPTSLEAILSDCEAAGKNFHFELNSGWYSPAFFFPAGCELTYETDATGAYTACNCTYASDAGVNALKALINLHKSPAFVNGSDVSSATNAAAIVSGTWNSGAAKDMFGENYACAKLPTAKIGDADVQLGGFGGFKLLGVKPQTDEAKALACLELAKYLSGSEVQTARFEAVGWGPSNLEAQQSDAVKSDEALSALAEQLAYTIPQGQYPQDYWTLATGLGDSIIAGDYDNFTDEQLLGVLQDFQTSCESYATAQ